MQTFPPENVQEKKHTCAEYLRGEVGIEALSIRMGFFLKNPKSYKGSHICLHLKPLYSNRLPKCIYHYLKNNISCQL